MCCAVYDEKRFSINSFLELPRRDIEKSIDEHSYCENCMKNGLHVYSLFLGHKISPIFEEIVAEEIQKTRLSH